MNVLNRLIFVLVAASALVSCGKEVKGPREVTEDSAYFDSTGEVSARPKLPDVANPNLIGESGFLGILPGTPIVESGDKLDKGILENGAGRYPVYYVKDAAGKRVGYALPAREDSTSVGDIVVTSLEYFDGKGIGIGGTWEELKTAYPGIIAYGSETEARVYAVNAPLSYRLDYAGDKYEFDNGEIPGDTRITEIVVKK